MRTILIVDDEATLRYATRRALENTYDVIEADSAAVARAVLARQRPSLVLLDIVMPGEDGISLLRWMRANGHESPVVMLSALDMAQTAVEALQHCASDYLVKGCDINELRARVGNTIALAEAREENARIAAQIAGEQERRKRELATARGLQNALFPHTALEQCGLQVAARYVSASEIGGDLYAFHEQGPAEFALALGDVTGKGAAAALFSAVVTGALRSLAPRGLAPAEMLRCVNELLCAHEIPARFATLCFATWKQNTGELRMANAGQSQPLVCRAGQCENVPLEGLPVGMFGDARYDEWTTRLAAGDLLIFHSDGITESLDAHEEQFGLERLRAVIEGHAARSAAEIADQILREVEEFSPGAGAADDRTLLVAKVL